MIDVATERQAEYIDWLDAETHAAAVALYDEYHGYYKRGLLSGREWEDWTEGHRAALTEGLSRFDLTTRGIVTWHIDRDALLEFGAIDDPYWRTKTS